MVNILVDCAIPEETLSDVQVKLMCNTLRLATKMEAIGVDIIAVQMAKTKTIYIFGSMSVCYLRRNFRLRIADHEIYKRTHKRRRKLTIELNRKVMLEKDFDDFCVEYATDISLEIQKLLSGG